MRLPTNTRPLKCIRLCRIVLGIICCTSIHAAPPAPSPVLQTQNKLKQIDTRISNLKRTLSTAQDKRALLNQELAETEKYIGSGINKLRTIEQEISFKEKKIAEVQAQIAALNQRIAKQQHLLSMHVRARYQMGEYQPLKWLLNQNDPYKMNRMLTYFHYIIQSRLRLMDDITQTRNQIKKDTQILHTELSQKHTLHNQLTHDQKQLEHTKSYHTALIHTIDNEIKAHHNTLTTAQKDKDKLTKLMQTLAQQSITQNSKPFALMRKKLPRPVQSPPGSTHRMNQGVTFFADEGTVVTAIYPGKVVFSDWLKGYGLLLIIDHGQGFMSLYAHNQSLFKRTGQTVSQSEHIARVGHSGGIKQNGLYFEIRQRGKAVSPLDWLA